MQTATWVALVVLSGLLVGRPGWASSPALAIAAGVMIAVAAASVVPRRGGAWITAAILVLGAGTVAIAGYAALGLARPLAPAFAQEPGQSALFVLRAGLCAAVCFALERAAPTTPVRVRRIAVATTALGLLLSLAFQGTLLGFVALAVGWIRTLEGRSTAAAPRGFLPAVAAVGVVLLFVPKPSLAKDPMPSDPAEEVAAWQGRGNPWRARWTALGWASAEKPPGSAYLTLAALDWDLGKRDQARRVLSKVLAGPAQSDIQQRAADLQRRFGP